MAARPAVGGDQAEQAGYRGAWAFTDGRWFWCSYDGLHHMVDVAIRHEREIIVVPERPGPRHPPHAPDVLPPAELLPAQSTD